MEVPHKGEIKTGWTNILVLAGVATTFGSSLPVGYNIGVVNAPADIIKQFCNESIYMRYGVELSQDALGLLWSSVVSIFLIGGAVGSLTGSYLADILGRKGAIVTSTCLSIFAGILFVTSKLFYSVEILLAGRLIIGLSAGLITCTIPMYLTELAPIKLRGSMGVICPLGINFGVLLGQIMSLRTVLGTEEFWPYLLGFYTILVLLSALAIPFLPESPKYLLFIKKNSEEASIQLSRIRNTPIEFLHEEIQEMNLSIRLCDNGDRKEQWNLIKVLKDRKLLLPLLLVCAMQAGQQLSGINAVFYYSVSIFMEAGLSEWNSQLATIGAGSINLLMAVLSIPIMAYFTRRTIMQISCFLAAFCLFTLALAISYISVITWMSYVSIAAVLSFVLCYGLGLGPIPYFIGSELFEVGPRPSAMALGSMANWGANFMIGMSFPALQDSIGAASFLVFSFITLGLVLFLKVYLPETKGHDPSEIALICKHGLRSRVLDASIKQKESWNM